MSHLKHILLPLLLILAVCGSAYGQRQRRDLRGRSGDLYVPVYKDTTKNVISDSLRAVIDSTHRADSLFKLDSMALMKESSLEFPAFSAAKDSIREDFSNGRQMLYYYGDVSVSYGTMKLTADYMQYDMQTQTVFAKGTTDPVTGEVKGNPVMTDNGKTYEMEEVSYNFGTRKAFIKNVVTTEDEGILHGDNIKMMPDQSINVKGGRYTVCDCEEPHYYLQMTSAKVMTKPRRTTVFGPAWPVFEGVPFPIVLPFGFIPKKPERASGLLMPTFGEEQARGFYMRDLGVYFVFGDYIDISLTGSYYTLGSWNVDFNSRYKVNYKCNGSVGLTYSYDQVGEKGEPDFSSTANFAVKWSHQMDPKARPGTSFSASVNFSTPSNSRYNSHSVQEALNNQISSSVSYARNWNGKFNLSVNGLHSQNSRDSSYAITLPNITFSVSKFYPFKRKHRVGKERFYEKFSLSYNTAFQNKINFKSSQVREPDFFNKMQSGMKHNFSIGLPSFTLFKYINVNPSVNYNMSWFFDSKQKVYNPETDKVEDVRSGLFKAFGMQHDYSGSISMDTQLYGLFNFGKHHKIQAIRHIVKPSVSMSFAPEKGTYFNGWRTLEYTDNNGNFKTLDYNIYDGQMNAMSSRGKSATANFSLGNNFEAKVRDYRDTTGTGSKKVKLIDQLNFNTSYNFLADSCRLAPIGITLSTNVLGKVGINANVRLDPYGVSKTGQRIGKFAWDTERSLMRLTDASISASYSINGKGHIDGNDGSKNSKEGNDGGSSSGRGSKMPSYVRTYYHPVTGEYIPGGWLYYTNPDSPWSINLSYSFNYRLGYQKKEDLLVKKHNFTQTLNISGNVKVTNALSISATTGFDIQALKITTTQISATYDLHCFNISFSWVPTGTWKSWSFTIAANASQLADILKFKKSTSYWDN